MEEFNVCSITIDADILNRGDLTAQEKVVLAQVRQFGKCGKTCTFSNTTFGKILSVSPDRAGRVVASLINKNYLSVVPEAFNGRHRVLAVPGLPLMNSSIGENTEAASANSTMPAEPTDQSIGENTEAASADSTKQRGCIGESAEEILNNISTKIKVKFKAKFFADTEFQRFSRYVLEKKQTPAKEPLDTEGRIMKFAGEWRPLDTNSTWLPEVDGEYRRSIFHFLAKAYANYPEKLVQITHIQRNADRNTIEIMVSGHRAWFEDKALEIKKLLHNFSINSSDPGIIIKTDNK